MKQIFIAIIVLLSFTSLTAQQVAGEKADFEHRFLIDMPAAGVLNKGYVSVMTDLLPYGIMITRIDVGVFDNFSFGISYGGENIIGSGEVTWYKQPGVNAKFKIFNENANLPSITVGFDMQGKGRYFERDNRYEIKSPGFYAAVSKNYEFLGYLSLHGVVNYSLEGDDGQNFTNLMIGVEKTLGPQVSLVVDYNFGFNDNNTNRYGKGNGYLNAGLRWTVGSGFTIGFDLRDLLNNKLWSPATADRAIRFDFTQRIL